MAAAPTLIVAEGDKLALVGVTDDDKDVDGVLDAVAVSLVVPEEDGLAPNDNEAVAVPERVPLAVIELLKLFEIEALIVGLKDMDTVLEDDWVGVLLAVSEFVAVLLAVSESDGVPDGEAATEGVIELVLVSVDETDIDTVFDAVEVKLWEIESVPVPLGDRVDVLELDAVAVSVLLPVRVCELLGVLLAVPLFVAVSEFVAVIDDVAVFVFEEVLV
jgi:hypothetical protein